MTCAIAFRGEDGTSKLAAVREVKPPFSPDVTVEDFCALFRTYRVREVVGDRWGSGFVQEAFEKTRGITYKVSDRNKSDIYKELLPLLNSGKIELLDLPRLHAQLLGLERRTARGGKDSIDHSQGGHDDMINAAALALVLAAGVGVDDVVAEYIAAFGPGGGWDQGNFRLGWR